MKAFDLSFRVYYEDTDAAGVVYHANYLKFAERARTEWLRNLGFEQSQLMNNDVVIPVFKLAIDFVSPARLDDLLIIKTKLIELKKVQMTLEQDIVCDGQLIAHLIVQVACCSNAKKPRKWPQEIYDIMQKHLV